MSKKMNKWSKKSISILLTICLALGVFTLGVFAGGEESSQEIALNMPLFTDVQNGDSFFPYVQFVHENGIMIGTSTTTFAPNANFSRAMMAATLFRMHHNRLANANDSRVHLFTDVGNNWYTPYISWAYRNDIAVGVGGGNFAPHANISAQEFLTMLHNYASPASSVPQSAQRSSIVDNDQIPDWAADALDWGVHQGLITYDSEEITPFSASVSRAEIATIITVFIRGATETPPQGVNIADLLGANFNTVRPQLGNVIYDLGHGAGGLFFFDTGLSVDVNYNNITEVFVNYLRAGNDSIFHLNGVDGTSTRTEVHAALGLPTVGENIQIRSDANGTSLVFFEGWNLEDAPMSNSDRVVGITLTPPLGHETAHNWWDLWREVGGNQSGPEPPTAQRVDIAEMIGRNFNEVQHLFGSLTSTFSGMWLHHYFDTGLRVSTDDWGHGETIVHISIDYRQAGSANFHLDGIDNTSTRSDISARFGAPDFLPEIGGYTYFLEHYNYVQFSFDGSNRVIEISFGSMP